MGSGRISFRLPFIVESFDGTEQRTATDVAGSLWPSYVIIGQEMPKCKAVVASIRLATQETS
jgi:hypothetical protein